MKTAALVVMVLLIIGCVHPPIAPVSKNTNAMDELEELEKLLHEESSHDSKEHVNGVPVETETPQVHEHEILPPPSKPNADKDAGLTKIEIFETEQFDLKVDAQDPDKDKLQITYSAPLNALGKWRTDFGDAGEYIATVTVTDGKLTTSQNVLLVVKKKNVAPIIENVPSTLTVYEGDLIVLQPFVVDKNNDPIILLFSQPLDAEGKWQTDFKSAGEYTLTVTARDGEFKTEAILHVVVKDKNQAPTISGVEDRIVIKEGEHIVLKPIVSDSDGDDLAVSISEPVGNDGLWETTYTDAGEYTTTIVATDGKDQTKKEITIIVQDVNKAPQIIGIRQG